MSDNSVIEYLLKQKEKLTSERDAQWVVISKQIDALMKAIESLSGKKISEVEDAVTYDDEHPDYIKGSQEEM